MEWGYGFNAKTLQYENLLEAGVADPASVTTWALENAASISGSLLTTECLITDTERQDDEDADFVPDITTGMGKDVDQYAW
jgi:chaperonin GroEL